MLPLLTLLAASCAEAAETDDVRLRIVRGTGVAEPVLTIPRGAGAAKICAGRGLAEPAGFVPGESVPLFPARGVQAATRSVPFAAMSDRPERACDVVLLGEPLNGADGAGERLDYGRCSILIRSDGRAVLIAPSAPISDPQDRFVLAECIYRLAMYVEGYRGALAEPAATLFQERSASPQFAGAYYVGPFAPWLPSLLELRCRQLTSFYYRTDLAEALTRSCPHALSPPATRP